MKPENCIGRQHVRRTQNRIAAPGVKHRQLGDCEIVAIVRIRLRDFGLSQTRQDATGQTSGWHGAALRGKRLELQQKGAD
jgi:hypothetical protein